MSIGGPKGAKKSDVITALMEGQVFNDVTTSKNSETIDTEDFKEFALFLFIDSTLTPTDIVFKVQFSNDGGTTWFDLQNDFWSDLRYEDSATAAGIREVLAGPCIGRKIRLRVVATGTGAANKFTVSAYLGLYR